MHTQANRSENVMGCNNCHAKDHAYIMAMEMDKIELMVELQVFTHIHDQHAVHRQFIPDTQ